MAQLSQLLLFDTDPSGLDALTYGFEKDGCAVVGTDQPAKARELVHGGGLSLVVINLRDPEQTGLDLLRAITSNPRTRNLACLTIGREEFRSAALAAGAFVFLSAPLFVRDILSASRLVVAASVPGSRPSPDTELTLGLGALDGMYFLVRALAVTGRSAVIEVRRGTKRAELRFIDGTLASAQLGPVQGLPALHQMLLWDDAELRFKFRNVVRSGTQLSMKSSEVIEECDRFLRDFAHEVKDIGVAQTIYSTNGVHVQPASSLPNEVVPVLRLFDGGQSLGQVLEDSPFRVFDTLKIIKRFVDGEAISLQTPLPVPPQEAAAALSGPAALDRWLQRQVPALGPEGRKAAVDTARPAGESPHTDGKAAGKTSNTADEAPKAVGQPAGETTATGLGPALDPRAPSPGDAGPAATVSSGSDGPPGLAAVSTSTAEARSSSPFVAVQDSPPAVDTGDLGQRHRIITLREHVISSPAETTAVLFGTSPPLARTGEGSAKPTAVVARGEIRVASPTPGAIETAPGPDAPSVLIEIGPLPAPVPLAAFAPAPMSALSPSPSVIVAPAVDAAKESAPPRVHAAAAAGPNNSGRSAPHGFNDVEADFFDREADLYKREKIESFDDLDRKPGSRRPVGGSTRKP